VSQASERRGNLTHPVTALRAEPPLSRGDSPRRVRLRSATPREIADPASTVAKKTTVVRWKPDRPASKKAGSGKDREGKR